MKNVNFKFQKEFIELLEKTMNILISEKCVEIVHSEFFPPLPSEGEVWTAVIKFSVNQ